MGTTFQTKIIPARGPKGSNQAIIRAMRPAQWVVDGDGQPVLKGDVHFCETRAKGNAFWSSGHKMGVKIVRRKEGDGYNCWVVEKEKKS